MPDKRSRLREAASNIKESVAGTVEAAKTAVTGKDDPFDDNLGPDRGTTDQLEARKERARIEARQEAQKEQRKEKVEQAREDAREQAKQEFAEENSGLLSKLATAVQTDFDGDGEPFGAEIGLQTEQEARQDNQQTARAIQQNRQGIATNKEQIESIEPGAAMGQPAPRDGPSEPQPMDIGEPEPLPPSPMEQAIADFREPVEEQQMPRERQEPARRGPPGDPTQPSEIGLPPLFGGGR
jgi:hypothetical protein